MRLRRLAAESRVKKALTDEERVRHRAIREQVEQEKPALIAHGRRAKARHTINSILMRRGRTIRKYRPEIPQCAQPRAWILAKSRSRELWPSIVTMSPPSQGKSKGAFSSLSQARVKQEWFRLPDCDLRHVRVFWIEEQIILAADHHTGHA